ncbi:hypothetical protein BKK79_03865 [Cupriavidus sp. USMAA2-4]|uniref:Tetratricopeptide repeat protein n=1 Tax=Cupriavidus malaysiensis TaxID=367825 RepID=A0ABM6F437_9BURK|nr:MULTISPECIES: tetratricopeptide repeat protein [Cupriavidus]AOY91045.1 hypothetical protein BKK79_03865 [Cupriavidus sp. USMAA2-4]AOY99380.1 hypothetical protein BKK81_08965 [Cupriavidus sp. USMAHM13]AOZ05997.1 hypothetical protein BKK80_09250 [Cupriavidus malaysiensis]
MSLLLPSLEFAAARLRARRGAAAATAAVLLAGLPCLAQAQMPMSLAAPAASTPVRSADPGMADAEKAVSQKHYAQAVEQFDRVLAANPRNVQARFERAWALAQGGREQDAERAFAEIAQDFPELPEPHNNLALLYARRGELKRAEAELLLAIDVNPAFAVAYTNLGDVYRRLAEQAYADALRRSPGDARASAALGQLRQAAAPAAPAAAKPAAGANPASSPAAR